MITSTGLKLYVRMLKNRTKSESLDKKEEGGFRAGRSCFDKTLEQLVEIKIANNLKTHLMIIDLKRRITACQ